MKHHGIATTLLVLFVITPALAAAPETVGMPVQEGVTLATDLYRPDKVPAPVILIRTPYGKEGYDFLGRGFSERGYVVVIQDVRGKYDSGGEHVPFLNERADGLVTLDWIAKQEWCNGRIGMWGQSYSGFAALVVADAENEALRSLLSFSGWLDAGEIVKPGGSMHLMLDLPWMMSQQGQRQRSISEFDLDALFRHTPLIDALRAAGIRNPAWEDPGFLDTLGEAPKLGKVDRPVLHITGWHDMVYRASLSVFQDLSGNSEATQKLIVGPWYHDQMVIGDWTVGDIDFGVASGFGTDELIALSIRWFDATLKGKGKGFLREPAVTYFMMGQNAWQKEETWPPAGKTMETRRWYLDSHGAANGLDGNGVLAPTLPAGTDRDQFLFDPDNPVPTFGGANFHFFPDLLGVRDQRQIENRDDVLVYTSEPLDHELQITGRITAHLHAATTGQDTDFTAKLVVVRPDGYAGIVVEGIARVSALLSLIPPPGEPFAVTVDMGQTAIAIPAGHRLRLEVSSSNFPKYDRNPNTGENPFTATEFRQAHQTLFHTSTRASFLELPVRSRTLVATARGREPLIEPLKPARKTAGARGGNPEELMEEGRRQLDAGKFEEAVASLERAVELRPEDPESHYLLGRACLAQLQRASLMKRLVLSRKVRNAYMTAIELDPEYLDARSSLASFYFSAPAIAGGSEEKGLEQVTEIGKRDPKTAHKLLGGHYEDRGEPAEAIAEYLAVIALDPEDPDPYYRTGLVHQREKNWSEAFDAFEKGYQTTGDLRALYQFGRTGVLSGEKLDRSRQAFEEYIAADLIPDRYASRAHAHWRLGMIFERQGRKDQARRAYETALSLDPELEPAREALENLG